MKLMKNNAVSFYGTILTIYRLNNQFQSCTVSITVHAVPPKLKGIIKLKYKYVMWELGPWHNKNVNLEKTANNISTESIYMSYLWVLQRWQQWLR